MCATAGSAAAPTASCSKCLRGSFIDTPQRRRAMRLHAQYVNDGAETPADSTRAATYNGRDFGMSAGSSDKRLYQPCEQRKGLRRRSCLRRISPFLLQRIIASWPEASFAATRRYVRSRVVMVQLLGCRQGQSPGTHELNESSGDDFEPRTERNQPAGGLPE